MEKGINQYILEHFQIQEQDIKSYSPLTLAFIGDGAFDLIIRSIVVGKGNTSANQLHRQTSRIVKAAAQSEMIEKILPYLTADEEAVYKRGRNAKSGTMAKNATMVEYRRATGFEALMGYLYLKNEFSRMIELIKIGMEEQ